MAKGLRVLAVDPGERCGWARAIVHPDATWTGVYHGITELKDMALKIHERVGDYDVLVYETFRLTRRGAQTMVGSDLQTAQMVGMMRLAAWLNPEVKLVGQGPTIKSTARRTAPASLQEVLARMPSAHDDAHDGDALLHLWHWTWVQYV